MRSAIKLSGAAALLCAALDLQCFDTCLSWTVKYCKRVGNRRAKCVATVLFRDQAGTTECRIINRWRQDADGTGIYEISKRCRPA